MEKETQTLLEYEKAITTQPSSYSSLNNNPQQAVIPIEAKSTISIDCKNCQCCIFNFIRN